MRRSPLKVSSPSTRHQRAGVAEVHEPTVLHTSISVTCLRYWLCDVAEHGDSGIGGTQPA